VARMLSGLPLTMQLWRDGALSDGQVEAIAANLDAGTLGLFAEHEPEVVPTLVDMTVDGVVAAMSHWRSLATADREPVERPQGLHASRGLDNRWRLDGTLNAETGELLTTALDVARSDDVEGEPPRSPAERRADALADICRHFLDNQQKRRGGRHRPHVNAMVDLDKLLAGHATAECPDGTVLSYATITRLLCDCAIHRVVTKGGSAILDYGRTTQTIPAALFNALVVRDRHCRFPGCDRPASWADGTTSNTGSTAAPPAWRTWSCSADGTTANSTNPAGTPSSSPTQPSKSPAPQATSGRRHPPWPGHPTFPWCRAPSGRTSSRRRRVTALAREGRAVPAGPPVTQRHAGEPCHQVELGGPHVPERGPELAHARLAGGEVVGRGLLGDEVGVAVVPHVTGGVGEHVGVLAGRQAAKVGDSDLDHEAAARFEVAGGVREARHLLVLGGRPHPRIVPPAGAREFPTRDLLTVDRKRVRFDAWTSCVGR
jgi:hypothetical protein